MATNAERQAAFRRRQAANGKCPVTVFVHEHQVANLKALAQLLASDPDLEVTVARSARSGRFKKI